MSKTFDNAKLQYQKFLEKKIIAERERGETVFVPNNLPADSVPLCFGVIGTGHVFDRWMHDMLMLPVSAEVKVKGIVARSEAAMKKAKQYGITVTYSAFETMLADPDIQAVYVATPNHLHKAHVIQALQAGKHVLCEKPIAVNTDELIEMYATADATDRFLMEGLWMRTLPMIRKIKEIVEADEIGTVQFVETTCCNSNSPEHYPAMYSVEKAGGALMDVGCYGIHFTRLFLKGEPSMRSNAVLSSSGVDLTSTATFQYADSVAVVTQSIGAAGGARAFLHGTKGSIEIPLFLSPSEFKMTALDGYKTYYRYKKPKEKRPIGYAYEILHFSNCLQKELRDSSLIPRSETIAVARQMERIRIENKIFLGRELKDR